ncbi:MAG: protein-glutamate O-methyltransferase CheR [Acidobacteria bacterium]|nr:protein-glutamate O-methyltransferase CheR [Acidobacteriota bacterium]
METLAISTLLEAIYDRTGLDFREYASASLTRRIRMRMEAEQVGGVAALQERALRDPDCLERLLESFSITTTAMFRDPGFFREFRARVAPLLRTYPFRRIWQVGCSTGEEVFSMAILLQEEGLQERTRIYATDFNKAVLEKAKAGIFPLAKMKAYTENYLKAGGRGAFSDYYTARYGAARFDPALVRNVLFARHNLATDASFNDFHAILCRNVMIYFNRELQDRVHRLLHESLIRLGVLGLGDKESLALTPHESCYEPLNSHQKLFRRMR